MKVTLDPPVERLGTITLTGTEAAKLWLGLAPSPNKPCGDMAVIAQFFAALEKISQG